MQPPAAVARISRRGLTTLLLVTVLLAAAAVPYAIRSRLHHFRTPVADLAVVEAEARARARPCTPRPPRATWEKLGEARASVASSRGLPPPAALRAQLAVLRSGVEYPACRATLLAVSFSAEMMRISEDAIRATWNAPELTAADRAAAVAALATLDATRPSLDQIITDETDASLRLLAPSLRGEPAPVHQQMSQQAAQAYLDDVLSERARWRAACPSGTSFAACATRLPGRGARDLLSEMLRRFGDRQAGLVALRTELAAR